jgi:transcriptional regulator, putative
MEDLGKVFRDFRLNGQYSLKEAAGQVCSTSATSFVFVEKNLIFTKDSSRLE